MGTAKKNNFFAGISYTHVIGQLFLHLSLFRYNSGPL